MPFKRNTTVISILPRSKQRGSLICYRSHSWQDLNPDNQTAASVQESYASPAGTQPVSLPELVPLLGEACSMLVSALHSAHPAHTGCLSCSKPFSLHHSAAGEVCFSQMPGLGQAVSILFHSGRGWKLSKAGIFLFVLFFLLFLLVLFLIQLVEPSPLLSNKCFKNKTKQNKSQLSELLRVRLCSEQQVSWTWEEEQDSTCRPQCQELGSRSSQPRQAHTGTAPSRQT